VEVFFTTKIAMLYHGYQVVFWWDDDEDRFVPDPTCWVRNS